MCHADALPYVDRALAILTDAQESCCVLQQVVDAL